MSSSMLPGFRFLLAAIALSTSILVFGLGAAALLRAAHEEFASNASWRATPDTIGGQQSEATKVAIALLRIEPGRAEQTGGDAAPVIALTPIAPPAPKLENIAGQSPRDAAERVLPSDTKPDTADPDRLAPALAESGAAEANPGSGEALKTDSPPRDPVAALLEAQAAAQSDARAAPTPATDQNKVASAESTLQLATASPIASDPAPSASGQTGAMPVDPDPATVKVATLGGPPVEIETQTQDKAISATPDKEELKRRQRARRARLRQRLEAYRARLAREAAAAQAANLFVPPIVQPVQPAYSIQPVQPIAQRRPRTEAAATDAAAGQHRARSQKLADQAGPVATAGPSDSPHSAQEPSYSDDPRAPSR